MVINFFSHYYIFIFIWVLEKLENQLKNQQPLHLKKNQQQLIVVQELKNQQQEKLQQEKLQQEKLQQEKLQLKNQQLATISPLV